jgi:hypothetical protein
MTVRRLLAATAIVVAASMSESYAGPCAQEIDRVQAKIDARLEAKAARWIVRTPPKRGLVTFRRNE